MNKIKFIFNNLKISYLLKCLMMILVAVLLWSGSDFWTYAAQDLITTHLDAQGRGVTLNVDIAKDSQITSGRIKIHYPQELLGEAEVQGGNLWEICDVNTELIENGQSVASFAWADVEKCTEEGNVLSLKWEAWDTANGKEIAVETEVVELYSQEKRILSNQDIITDRLRLDFPGIGGHTAGAVRTGDESNAAGPALLCMGAVLVMARLLRLKIDG